MMETSPTKTAGVGSADRVAVGQASTTSAHSVDGETSDGARAHSGTDVDRVVLGDGQTLVLKTLRPERDFVMWATRDPGRAALLWVAGVLQHLPRCIDPAVLLVGRRPEGWTLAMRDVSGALLTQRRVLSRKESLRILRAVSEMHRGFQETAIPHLCTLSEYFGLSAPALTRRAPSRHPLQARVLRGWELFAELVPARRVRRRLRDPRSARAPGP